ncbi:MAG: glycosyl hydrolase family 28-related protein, partial [Verrucomicrobia bacterium]|nr:glycosyl hydrolase family 28-related protein [Verrucomicrobiota bacterium]
MKQNIKCVTEFGARPDTHTDPTEALRRAATFARETPGATLRFPPGQYRLRDPQALALENAVMTGEMGPDPEKNIFRPYYPYVKGLDFTGA